MKKSFRKFLTACMCAVMTFFVTATAFADENYEKSIKIVCENDGIVMENLELSVYQCATNISQEYFLSGDFEDCGVVFDNTSSSTLQTTANSLANVVLSDNITPLATATTDESGNAEFSSLQNGVYLICGKTLTTETTEYKFSPMIVEVSYATDDVVICYGKFTATDIPQPEITEYSVKKVWVCESDDSAVRPTEISVEIYLNSELFDTVALNSENNWTVSWESDQIDAQWSVKEINIPEGYTVSYSNDSTSFEVVNTYSVTPPQENPPQENPPTEPDIPQTGQLWWPVPIMIIVGLVLVALGMKIGFKGEKE